MEIKEKLEIFNEAVIQAATKQSEEILEEYKKNYQDSISDYEKQKVREQETRQRIEEAKLRRDINRRISEESMSLKKIYHKETEEKKALLFQRVEEKLRDYQQTDAYKDYLVQEIKKAKQFAKQDEITIYINASDEGFKEQLEAKTGCVLTISTIDFTGGIRAVIRSRNILIDESFSSKLEQERENYSFL